MNSQFHYFRLSRFYNALLNLKIPNMTEYHVDLRMMLLRLNISPLKVISRQNHV